jgi:hypothetical protein
VVKLVKKQITLNDEIDKKIIAWFDAQPNYSRSIRKIVEEIIADYGIVDYTLILHDHIIYIDSEGIMRARHGQYDPQSPSVQKVMDE